MKEIMKKTKIKVFYNLLEALHKLFYFIVLN